MPHVFLGVRAAADDVLCCCRLCVQARDMCTRLPRQGWRGCVIIDLSVDGACLLSLQGADPNSKTEAGTTALHWSSVTMNIETIKILLAR
jgi:ankyrin repeat protein